MKFHYSLFATASTILAVGSGAFARNAASETDNHHHRRRMSTTTAEQLEMLGMGGQIKSSTLPPSGGESNSERIDMLGMESQGGQTKSSTLPPRADGQGRPQPNPGGLMTGMLLNHGSNPNTMGNNMGMSSPTPINCMPEDQGFVFTSTNAEQGNELLVQMLNLSRESGSEDFHIEGRKKAGWPGLF